MDHGLAGGLRGGLRLILATVVDNIVIDVVVRYYIRDHLRLSSCLRFLAAVLDDLGVFSDVLNFEIVLFSGLLGCGVFRWRLLDGFRLLRLCFIEPFETRFQLLRVGRTMRRDPLVSR